MKDENLLLKSKSRALITIEPRASVEQALKLMKSHQFRHLPVADGSQVVGVVSERDIQRATRIEIADLLSTKVVDESLDPNLIVADIMSWPVKTIDINEPLVKAIDHMLDLKVSSLLVLEEGHVVGIVTSHDFLSLLKTRLTETETSTFEEFQASWANSPVRSLIDALSQSGI